MKFFLNGHIKKILKKNQLFETKATLGLYLNHTDCFSFVIKWGKKQLHSSSIVTKPINLWN